MIYFQYDVAVSSVTVFVIYDKLIQRSGFPFHT